MHTHMRARTLRRSQVDESKWFTGGHLGGQTQRANWQARVLWRVCALTSDALHAARRRGMAMTP